MPRRVELTMPEPVFEYLSRRAAANKTMIGAEARTALLRGTLIEWCAEELAGGASLSELASITDLPLELVLEALGPVAGQGSPLKGYD